MIKVFILIVFVLLVSLSLFAAIGTSIQGGQVKVTGGYVAIGKQVPEEVVVISSATGQCIGLMCGLTHAE